MLRSSMTLSTLDPGSYGTTVCGCQDSIFQSTRVMSGLHPEHNTPKTAVADALTYCTPSTCIKGPRTQNDRVYGPNTISILGFGP